MTDPLVRPSYAGVRPGPRPRLIATDLDGTLLRDDKTVSDRTVAALAAAEAAGVQVFFVTGRPARWMGVVRDHVHGHGLAICANGAAVVDLHRGGRLVRVRALERDSGLAVVDALREAAPGVTFAVERTSGIYYEPGYPAFPLDPGTLTAPAEKLLMMDVPETDEGTVPHDGPGALGGPGAHGDTGAPAGVQDGPAHPVLKVLAHHQDLDPDDFLTLGRTHAGGHAEFTRSSPSALLEISGSGVSKASTLAQCCAERGIAPEEVVAFGDMPNDLEMLTWAGTSYAMANAHPAVLAATTHRTSTNGEDGVAAVIERLLSSDD